MSASACARSTGGEGLRATNLVGSMWFCVCWQSTGVMHVSHKHQQSPLCTAAFVCTYAIPCSGCLCAVCVLLTWLPDVTASSAAAMRASMSPSTPPPSALCVSSGSILEVSSHMASSTIWQGQRKTTTTLTGPKGSMLAVNPKLSRARLSHRTIVRTQCCWLFCRTLQWSLLAGWWR